MQIEIEKTASRLVILCVIFINEIHLLLFSYVDYANESKLRIN